MEHESKVALNHLLDVVRSADETFLNPEKNLDPQGKVDGYLHLFHLAQLAIDFYIHNDPIAPHFCLLADPYRKVYGDNVDAVYYFSQLQSDQEYVIRGKKYESVYLSFCLYGGPPDGEFADRVALNINHRDIEFNEDGSFEIKLTGKPYGKNEFKLDHDVVTIFTREYFVDRFNSRESDLSIENTIPQSASKPITDKELTRKINRAANFIKYTTLVAPLPVEFPLNDFLPPFQFDADQGGWGTIDNIYCFGRFHLKQNQYLRIHFTSPKCCYWGIQTWNYLMQSMDFKNYRVSINMGQATPNADGSYTIFLSHEKMDVDNWISTAGYQEAIIFCRWLLAETMPEQPECTVLELQ